MNDDQATLITDIKALETELEQAKQETKIAQEQYESARKQLLNAQYTANGECEEAFQVQMNEIAALRKTISQTHFDTQQQLGQLRQTLAATYDKLYKSSATSHTAALIKSSSDKPSQH